MSDRVYMSFEDMKNYTTHQAHQNELAAAKAVANTGCIYPEETPEHEAAESPTVEKAEHVAGMGEADGY